MAKKNWIQGAIRHPGALHSALGVPQGQTIPESKKTVKPGDSPRMAKMKNLANTLKKLRPSR